MLNEAFKDPIQVATNGCMRLTTYMQIMALKICDIIPRELEAIFIMYLGRSFMTISYKACLQK